MASPTTQAPRFGSEVRTTATLALPLVLGHVSTGLIGFVDNVIAGHHGTQTLAAVTIGTALLWLPMMVPIGTLIVADRCRCRNSNGAGRRDEIGPLFRQALWLALGLGALMFAFLSLLPCMLGPFGIAADIIPGATGFLHGIRWGVPALTLFFCMRYLSEGMHWTLADHAARLRRTAAAGTVGLRVHVRPFGHAGDGCGRAGRRFRDHDVGTGRSPSRCICGIQSVSPT